MNKKIQFPKGKFIKEAQNFNNLSCLEKNKFIEDFTINILVSSVCKDNFETVEHLFNFKKNVLGFTLQDFNEVKDIPNGMISVALKNNKLTQPILKELYKLDKKDVIYYLKKDILKNRMDDF